MFGKKNNGLERHNKMREAARAAALKELNGSWFTFVKNTFDGSGAGGRECTEAERLLGKGTHGLAARVRPELLESISRANGIPVENIYDGVAFTGEEVVRHIGSHLVVVYACKGSLVTGLFSGGEEPVKKNLLASIVITPGKKLAAATNKAFKSPESAGIYSALVDAFSPWFKDVFLDYNVDGNTTRNIPFTGIRSQIICTALFYGLSDSEPLEDRVIEISAITGLKPTTVCYNIRAGGVCTKGLTAAQLHFSAKEAGIPGLWKKFYVPSSSLEEVVRKIAAEAELDPVTVCGYLAHVIPREDLKGLRSVYTSLCAEKSNVADFWKECSALPLKERVCTVAENAGIDPVTACMYLAKSSVTADDKKSIAFLCNALCAEKSNVAGLWGGTKGSVKSRVERISAEAGIDPVTVCNYLLCTSVSEDNKGGIRRVRDEFFAEKLNVARLWKSHAGLEPEARVLAVVRDIEAAKGPISSVTVCRYLLLSGIPEKDRKELGSLLSRFYAIEKNVAKSWSESSGTPEERVEAVARALEISIHSACRYLISSDIPEADREAMRAVRRNLEKQKFGSGKSR